MRKIAGPDIAKLAYYSSFHGMALYGVLLWGLSTDAERVLIQQKKAVRAIFHMKNTDSCRKVFKRERILTITASFILTCANYVHQHHDKFPKNSNFHEYNTREKNKFAIPSARLKKTQQDPNHTCLKIYNKLPDHIKKLSPAVFSEKVKEILLDHKVYKLSFFLNE